MRISVHLLRCSLCLFLFQFSLLVPALFVLSTILGAMCLFIACICYFVVSQSIDAYNYNYTTYFCVCVGCLLVTLSSQAALNGEKWKAPSLAWGPGRTQKEEPTAGHTLPDAPSHPPPRPPQQVRETQFSEPPSAPPPRPAQKVE